MSYLRTVGTPNKPATKANKIMKRSLLLTLLTACAVAALLFSAVPTAVQSSSDWAQQASQPRVASDQGRDSTTAHPSKTATVNGLNAQAPASSIGLQSLLASSSSSDRDKDQRRSLHHSLMPSARVFPVMMMAPIVSASKNDAFAPTPGADVDGDGKFDPGDTIRYSVTIGNTGAGATDASNVSFTDTLDTNTTLVAGTTKISAMAVPNSYNAAGNTQLIVNAAGGVRANDFDIDGVTPTASLVVTAGTFATTAGGSITIAADGSFTYTPQTGDENLTDTYTYTVTDGDGMASSGLVSFNVGPRVWYVDSAYAGGGNDGSSTKPFTSLASVSGVTGPDTTNDIFFVKEATGDYTTGMTLLNNQEFYGSGVSLTVNTIVINTASSNTTMTTNGIIMASDDIVKGFTLSSISAGTAAIYTVAATCTVGTPCSNGTVDNLAINSTTGSVQGVSLTNTSGTWNFGNTATSMTLASNSIAGSDFVVSGGTSTINFKPAISSNSGRSVDISGHTGGTITFSNSVSDTGTGISLQTSTGSTTRFDAGLTISTGASAGFVATNGGTLAIVDPGGLGVGIDNTITTTTGTPLNLAFTTIHSDGVTFKSISSNGATNGISLNTTGTNGGFTITGDGGGSNNGSGGTIQNSTGDAINISSAKNISLNYINITNALTPSVTDDGIEMDNIQGTVTITRCTITGMPHNGIDIRNTSTNMTSFTMSNTTSSSNLAGTGNDGFLFVADGTSTVGASTVSNCTFASNQSRAVQVQADNTATISDFTVQNSTFTSNGFGVDFTHSLSANFTFHILTNNFQSTDSHAINVFTASAATGGTFIGKIDGNTVGTQGTIHSGSRIGNGLRAVIQGNVKASVVINNNQIREVPNFQVMDVIGQHGSNNPNTGSVKFKITNNVMPKPSGATTALCGPANQGCPDNTLRLIADQAYAVCTIITGNQAYDPQSGPNGAGLAAYYLSERVGPPAGAQLTLEGNTGLTVKQNILANNTVLNYAGGNGDYSEDGSPSVVAVGNCTTNPPGAPAFLSFAQPFDQDDYTVKPRLIEALAATLPSESIERINFVSETSASNTVAAGRTKRVTASRDDVRLAHSNTGRGRRDQRLSHATRTRAALAAALTPGQTVSFGPLATLYAGTTISARFDATIDTPVSPASTVQVSNQGTVSIQGFPNVLTDDPVPAGTADATVTPLDKADVSITKTDSPDPVDAGQDITYTLTITNNSSVVGSEHVAKNVTVTDVIPTNTTFVSVDPLPAGWSRTESPLLVTGDTGTLKFNTASLAPGASAVITVKVKVDTATANGTNISNTATVTSDTPDDVQANNTSGAVQTLVRKPADLSLTKVADNPTPNVGQNVIFTITLTNSGPFDAPGVTVGDLLPAGLTFVSANASQGSYVSGTGVWTVGTVTNGASPTLAITATVATPGAKTNNAQVTASGVFDPDSTPNDGVGDDFAGATVTPLQSDLALTKIVDDNSVNISDNVIFTITVSNTGTNPATGVVVQDSLPAGLTYVSDTPSQGTYVSGTGVWTVGTINNGSSATLSITATVTSAGLKTNSAQVSASDTYDTDSVPNDGAGDDFASVGVTGNKINSTTSVTSAPGPNPSFITQTVTYTATVTPTTPSVPTGTVDFFDAGNPITCENPVAEQSLDGSGKATCKVTYANTAGSPHQITATYNGDGTFNSSTSTPAFSHAVSAALSLVVNDSGDAPDLTLDNDCDTSAAAGSQCTLRAAIQESNNVPSPDSISFSLPAGSTISLGSALDSITDAVTITGPGADQLTVERNTGAATSFRIFNINTSGTVNISGLTVALGDVVGDGAGINNAGTATLNISNSTISGNKAQNSGGDAFGGGVNNASTGTINITASTISGNSALSTAGSGTGAGVSNLSTGTVNIINSTISGNTSSDNGGGVYNATTGAINITNSTITLNSAPGAGGGINNASTGAVILGNTIVAGNYGTNVNDPDDISGAMGASGSFNIVGVDVGMTGLLPASNNQIGTVGSPVDPRLDVLANNGGTTKTHALLSGSVALDAGSDALATAIPLVADQRGGAFNRFVDGPDAGSAATVDIGAFEAQVSVADIQDTSTNEDTALDVALNTSNNVVIGGITVTSSNTGLVPNANLTLTGAGSPYNLHITPLSNQSGTTTITVTVTSGAASMSDTFVLTVNSIADTPSVSNATTTEDTQTTSGLVITPSANDGGEVTHFKITGITGGTLYKHNGTTQINNGDFITVAEGADVGGFGLKFTPTTNLYSPSSTFGFTVQASLNNTDGGLGGSTANATITVNPVADTPSVTNTTTDEDTQSTTGLVITKNAADGTEVTHFKITGITNGTLFKHDGVTQINNGDFITVAEGADVGGFGLKFTPTTNLFSPSSTFSFTVQASLNNTDGGLGGSTVNATITVNPIADTPSVTDATTTEDTQTTTGLVITRNAADSTEVTHFKITSITGGTLYKHDGTTQINNGDFITVAEGADVGGFGLKFTPASNSFVAGSFKVQGATSAAGAGLSTGFATATITVNSVSDAPSVTGSTTNEDTQTTTGLVISRNAADGAEVTHFKITNITNGTLYQNDGSTAINNNDFITFAQGNAGLKFTPASNLYSPVSTFSFQVQGATDGSGTGLSAGSDTATITVNPIADTPSVTNASTSIGTQTTSGLVISRNAADDTEVTHFKITNITNGTLYQNDGVTQINNNDFITFAQGNAGLKFTPTGILADPNTFSFQVQASTSNANGGLGGGVVTATISVSCTTQLVTNTLDDGSVGSLRYAIAHSCPDTTLTFDSTAFAAGGSPYTITLASELLINKGLTIIGPTASRVILTGDTSRVFNITTGNVNISNLTVTQGSVTGANGAGLLNSSIGTVTLSNMLFTGNTATTGSGGAIATLAGTMNIYNTTISGNTADNGGGLYHATAGTVNVLNSTIYDNHADAGSGQGGGIYHSGGTTNIKNSIVTNNTGFVNPNVFGAITNQLNNLIDTAALLAPLANNGGPTQTHALLAGSPALDAGDNTASDTAGLTTDQRGTGFPRKADGPDANTTATVDIGAFEAHPSVEDITDKNTTEDAGLAPIVFNVGDATLGIGSVTATSSNQLLIPASNVAVSGSGSTRTLTLTPLADKFGTSTITVTVTSTIGGQDISMVDTFLVTVGTVADTPSVTNATTSEDTQTTSGLVITPNPADGAEVTHYRIIDITGGTLFQNDGVTPILHGDFITIAQGAAGLKFTPAPNSNLNGSFQVQASVNATPAGLGGGMAVATITVNAAADTPSVTNATTNEDTQTTSGLVILKNASDGAEINNFKITGITGGTLFKNDGTTVINNGAFITLAEGAAGLRFTPAANLSSPSTTFSFQVQAAFDASGTGLSAGSATATITVNTVPDTPSVTNATTNEDTQTTSGLVITPNPADGAEVTHYRIIDITGGTLFQNNGTTPINHGDFITIAQGAAGLKFTPAPNSNLDGSFQVQASLNATPAGLGGGLVVATITVNPVNDPPSFTKGADHVANEDSGAQTVNGWATAMSPGPAHESGQGMSFVIVSVSNPALFSVQPVVSPTGTLTYTPAPDAAGSTSVTLHLQDDGGTANGGVATSGQQNFNITINAVNDAPTNTVPGAQSTNLNTPLTFNGGNGNAISILDVDAATVEVTLTATHGTISLSGTAGLSFTTGDGTSDATMVFTGSPSSVNSALSGLVFTPTNGFMGAANLQITTNDLGNTGAGGALSDTDSVTINVADARHLQLSLPSFSVGEADGRATITVTRTGDTSQAASVDYATSDTSGLNNCNVFTGNASQRCDYTAMAGTVNFSAGQTSANFDVPIVNDVYVEGPETLTLTLSNPVGGILGAQAVSPLVINDNDLSPGAPNPISDPAFFVRQHYLDLLNREPEASGLQDWLNIINNCPAGDKSCDLIGVSSGFFRSAEFFDRTYFIYRFYRTALGRKPSYDEYQNDIKRVTGFLTAAQLEARKAEFAEAFVQRADFKALYDSHADGSDYVNAILTTAGVTPSNSADVANRQGAHIITRGQALRELVDSPEIGQAYFNEAFVVVGYFGYLRRDPDALYLVWIDKLNNPPAGQSFEDTYREMIRGFIESAEYRARFGP